jgi:hypothetical protein
MKNKKDKTNLKNFCLYNLSQNQYEYVLSVLSGCVGDTYKEVEDNDGDFEVDESRSSLNKLEAKDLYNRLKRRGGDV